jgi:hypothetical protein
MRSSRALIAVFTVLAMGSLACSFGIPGLFGRAAGTPDAQQTLDAIQGTLVAEETANPISKTIVFTTPQATETGAPSGSISGTLSYPSEYLPAQRVVAFNMDSKEWFAIEVDHDSSYVLDGLPPGSYYVVAYAIDTENAGAGGYTQAVSCGLSVNCKDHSLVSVSVKAGDMLQNINPTDWYAPAGSFPSDPALK